VKLEIDRSEDAVSVWLHDAPIHYSRDLEGQRFVYYDADENIICYEFHDVSRGVDVRDLPHAEQLAQLLREHGITLLT
jgi:hypothetical protein